MQELKQQQKRKENAAVFVSSKDNKTSIAYTLYTKSFMEQYYPYLIFSVFVCKNMKSNP